ncbi:MAG TPA: class III extradiol ring-cleavage dioxygenase [Polyangiaceae bacterium]|nr:class III extradiol ring-cleavage dioxygenase [Polyangiaceae bacterium]
MTRADSTPPTLTPRMPVVFLAHGSPLLLDDRGWVSELAAWGKALPRPRAVLMLSAHWVDAPITLGATRTVPLVYDFYGFPERYYQMQYAAPGAPELATRLRGLLANETVRDSQRGLDHGAYVPLASLYPNADVPVLQASLPSLDPGRLFALGKALSPLRDEGVLIIGSGFLTHNLRAADLRGGSPPPAWALEFDAWAADALARNDVDALLDFQKRAPAVDLALPTHEHYVPVLAALGAASSSQTLPKFPIQGFTYGSMTRRSVEWG